MKKKTINDFPKFIKAIEKPLIEKRDLNAHKGSFGTALTVTGSYGMPGASIISGRAAVRSGLGILRLACVAENYTACAVSIPEAVLIPCKTRGKTYSYSNIKRLKKALFGASSILIGCGLGVSRDAEKLIKELMLASSVPVILDADGINNLAPDIEFIKQVKAPLILTPHPGEMARMLGITVSEVEADRVNIAKRFATDYGVILCLKGANTLVATPSGEVFVNLIGNPGMATAGSGDMLAGIILALSARMEDTVSAVCAGVWLHSAAGDAAAAELNENAMLPSDMVEKLHRFI